MVNGTLRRRLLVNAVVDPDEAATRLPAGLRPHVTPLGTVVGCCLLEIERLRPAPLPGAAGITLRAAAHRISAEWDDEAGERSVGVYVPSRRTDSRLAVALGGRWFPGVHRSARVVIRDTSAGFSWRVQDDGEFGIAVEVSVCDEQPESEACDPIGGTCLGATVGLSPDHAGMLEAARMEPEHRNARQVVVEVVDSSFISSFSTARPVPAYLMQNVAVRWTRVAGPRLTAAAPV
jgi:hypothetical protein